MGFKFRTHNYLIVLNKYAYSINWDDSISVKIFQINLSLKLKLKIKEMFSQSEIPLHHPSYLRNINYLHPLLIMAVYPL